MPLDIARDEPTTLLPFAERVAQPDPERVGFHRWTDCGEIVLPDDADTLVLWCDRSKFPDTKERVVKLRAEIQTINGWLLIGSCAIAGEEYRDEKGALIEQTKVSFRLPPARGRMARVSAAMLMDTEISVGVTCERRNGNRG